MDQKLIYAYPYPPLGFIGFQPNTSIYSLAYKLSASIMMTCQTAK